MSSFMNFTCMKTIIIKKEIQVRFRQTNTHMKPDTNVSVITLDNIDHLNNCGRYIDKNGTLDITKGHSSMSVYY